jgi:hypothetical protein
VNNIANRLVIVVSSLGISLRGVHEPK